MTRKNIRAIFYSHKLVSKNYDRSESNNLSIKIHLISLNHSNIACTTKLVHFFLLAHKTIHSLKKKNSTKTRRENEEHEEKTHRTQIRNSVS